MKAKVTALNGDVFDMEFKSIDTPQMYCDYILVATKNGPVSVVRSVSWSVIQIVSAYEGTNKAGEDYTKLINASPFSMEWILPISEEYPTRRQYTIDDVWIIEDGDEFAPSLYYRRAQLT